jgi:two-component system chemotaxis response regulator CheB
MGVPVRVLIVDDSAFIRHTVTKYLETDPDIEVVGKAGDGIEALTQIPLLKPDVVILDVEMPRMDGLTALKRIMRECPTPVVMLSALTQQGTRATIQALMRGAFDFVSKPDTTVDIHVVIDELKGKVKAAAKTRPRMFTVPQISPISLPPQPGPQLLQKGDPVIVIGASTGGPRALQRVLFELPINLSAAILVVQHMPPKFTSSLAQRLNTTCPLMVQEATEGDRLAKGSVLIAPGNFHLQLKTRRQITLNQSPRRHHVRPSVDVTMESAVEYHQDRVIGVVLTGMGMDGTDGARQIKAAGGLVIAEHESTSVVYGMPASVIRAGLADYILPLPEIASTLTDLIKNERFGI